MIAIGTKRECFFDDYLLNTEKTTAQWRVHEPIRRECVIEHDEPWEGDGCNFHNFFWDEEKQIYRLYYLGWWMLGKSKGIRVCYAESKDGLNWVKPFLGICEFEGSRDNNIILDTTMHPNIDNFMVFKDGNPACTPERRYKAVCSNHEKEGFGLWHYYSEDGIHFKHGGMVTDKGFFDTLNIAFWDEQSGKYRCYFRSMHNIFDSTKIPKWGEPNVFADVDAWRDIRTMESDDFEHWSEPKQLDFADAEDIQLYTNLVQKYPRAPHIFVGFPTRYIRRNEWSRNFEELCGLQKRKERMEYNPRYGQVITDCTFMTSRDGVHFKRYDEAFMRPLPEFGNNWTYGDCYPARGFLETASDIKGADPELSMLAPDNHWMGEPARLIRYSMRCDGFVSLHAGDKEETIVTKPFTFEGSELRINFATSAWGYLYITLVAEDGTKVESGEIFGNKIDRRVGFPEGAVAALAGKAVTMEVRMRDADLYSMQFA